MLPQIFDLCLPNASTGAAFIPCRQREREGGRGGGQSGQLIHGTSFPQRDSFQIFLEKAALPEQKKHSRTGKTYRHVSKEEKSIMDLKSVWKAEGLFFMYFQLISSLMYFQLISSQFAVCIYFDAIYIYISLYIYCCCYMLLPRFARFTVPCVYDVCCWPLTASFSGTLRNMSSV